VSAAASEPAASEPSVQEELAAINSWENPPPTVEKWSYGSQGASSDWIQPSDEPFSESKKSYVLLKRESIDLNDEVEFEPGRALISAKSHKMLLQVADLLEANRDISLLRVEGHTDSRGSQARNLHLSTERAKAVVDFLVKHGVERERLEAIGHGETRPIASNKNARERSKNRRTELKIVAYDGRNLEGGWGFAQ